MIQANTDGGFTFTPHPSYTGSVSFTYDVTDGHDGFATGTITINVYRRNSPPIANDDNFHVEAGSDAFHIALEEILSNDVDPDDESLTVISFSQPNEGLLSRIPNGGFVYLPKGFLGNTSFAYTISDASGEMDTANINIYQVNSITNRHPEPEDDSYAAVEGQDLVVFEPGVLANDYDPDGDFLSVTPHTEHGQR